MFSLRMENEIKYVQKLHMRQYSHFQHFFSPFQKPQKSNDGVSLGDNIIKRKKLKVESLQQL